MLSTVTRETTVRDAEAPGIATQAVVFGLVAAAVALAAIDGGSYDLVVRQQWAVVLWWAIALAALLGLLPQTRPRVPGAVVLSSFVALAAWTAVSFTWTASDERTLAELSRVITHLGVVVIVAGALGPRTWHPAVAGATAGAVAICVYALITRLAPDSFAINTAVFAEDARRLSKPLGYWNAVGAWAGMTTALCLGWSAHAQSLVGRGLALAAVPLSALVAYLTYSRASLGGIALGLLVLLATSRNRWTLALHAAAAAAGTGLAVLVVRGAPEIADATGSAGAGKVVAALAGAAVAVGAVAAATGHFGMDRIRMRLKAARIALAITAVIAVVGAVTAALTFGPDAWDQFTAVPAGSTSSDPADRLTNLNGGRYQIWEAAWRSVWDSPWKGSGAGTFEFTWNERATRAEFVRDAHSLYLEALSELGVIGLLALLTLVGGVAAALLLALRGAGASERGALAGSAGAISAFFFGASLDWLWESTANAVLALVLVGTTLAATGVPIRSPRVPVRLALAVIAILCAATQLPGLVSTSEIRESQQASRAGDIAAARAHADDAIDAQPWAASPLVQRALVDEQAGALRAASVELRRAEALEPRNWRIPLILARIEARRGNADAALAAYARAKALRPRGQFFAQTNG